MHHVLYIFVSLGILTSLCSCQNASPLGQARNARFAQEPSGDHYIGRRYWVRGSRIWGWVRKPRQPWDRAKLMVTNERYKRNPDRLPERVDGQPTNGDDHNFEYHLWGNFSGDEIYDPTTNLILPEFVLRNWKLTSRAPGFLFYPSERMSNTRLLRTYHYTLTP